MCGMSSVTEDLTRASVGWLKTTTSSTVTMFGLSALIHHSPDMALPFQETVNAFMHSFQAIHGQVQLFFFFSERLNSEMHYNANCYLKLVDENYLMKM